MLTQPNMHHQHRKLLLLNLQWLDGKHVVFGSVETGLEVVREMEESGSVTGDTSKIIKISDCGEFLG